MRRFYQVVFVLGILFTFLLEGCTASTPTSSPTPTATPSPTPTPTATPILTPTATLTPTPVVFPPPPGKRGGILTVIGEADIPHRDVHQEVQETLTSVGPGIVYSRLLRLRMGHEVEQPSLLLECELCQGWELVDPFTYRFHLRPGIRWQTLAPVNGRELTAEDVVFSYQRLQTSGWPNSALFLAMKDIQAEGKRTLKVTLQFPDADFLLALADGHSKVVAKEAVDVTGDLRDGPVVGTGPWIWKSTLPGVGSEFERNPNYFEKGLPFLDGFVVRVIKTSEDERYAAFATGAVDVYRVPPERWIQLQDTGMNFNTILSKQGGVGSILAMNSSKPPFDNVQARKAVLKALDPWEYVDTIWAGEGFVSLGMPVTQPDWLLSREGMRDYFGDPSVARQSLFRFDGTSSLNIDFSVANYGEIFLRQGEVIEEALNAVGFNLTRRVLTPSEYAEKVVRDKDYQISLGVLSPTNTLNSFLLATLHSGGQWNLVDHSDQRLNSMIEKQTVELDSQQRRDQVRELQQYLLEQAYLFSPVTGPLRWASAPKVKGFYPNTALSEYFYWARSWIEE